MKSVVVLILLAVACGSDPKPPAGPDPNGILMLAPGSSPRQLLRYQLVSGAKLPLELVLDVEIDAGGQGSPLPRLTIGSELSIEEVRADGAARIRVTITRIAASTRELTTVSEKAMTEHMQLLRGTSLLGTLMPDGGLRELKADASVKLPPALSQQLGQVAAAFQRTAMPLPRVPVGPGARWRTIKGIDQGGMQLVAVTDLVVGTIEGSLVTYTMTSTLSGRDQTVTLLGMPIAMSGIGGTGSGRGSIDLSRMLLTGDATYAFHSDMTADGQTDIVKMTMTTHVGPAK